MIKITNTKGETVLLRAKDILSVWFMPERQCCIVNFNQNGTSMALHTEENLENLEQMIKEEIENENNN